MFCGFVQFCLIGVDGVVPEQEQYPLVLMSELEISSYRCVEFELKFDLILLKSSTL